jgi:hypothetical protein
MKKIYKFYHSLPDWLKSVLTVLCVFAIPMILVIIIISLASCEYIQENKVDTWIQALSESDSNAEDIEDQSFQKEHSDFNEAHPVGDKPYEKEVVII